MVETRFASPEGYISACKAAKEVLGRLRFGSVVIQIHKLHLHNII